jgi:cyclic nucleotide gated channel
VTTDLKRTAGVFIETAWAGAAYYLLWFMLAGHVSVSLCNYHILFYYLLLLRSLQKYGVDLVRSYLRFSNQ